MHSGVKSSVNNVLFKIVLATCAALLLCGGIAHAGEEDLTFRSAWVRAMPPGMKMTAAFGELRNGGGEDIELLACSSPQFGDVSLHRTELVDGVSRMREVPSLVIAAGETVELAPGGYHLMLMMPSGTLDADRPVTIEMRASDGRVFRFDLPIERH